MNARSWMRTFVGAVAGAAVAMVGAVVVAPAAVAADPAGTPVGHLDDAIVYEDGSVELVGWALDPDTPASVYVWVTVDGTDGHHIYANDPREDIAAAFPGYGPNHGFDVEGFFSPGWHTFCLTVSNVGPGAHKPLGCVDVEVPNLDPYGNFERARAVSGGVEIAGWAIDPDAPDPIYVWGTLDGVGRHVYANQHRADLEAAFPFYGGNHGFSTTLAASPGTHTVCVTASNIYYGDHTRLGCRTVTVTDPHAPIGNYENASPWLLTDAGAVTGLGVFVKGWAIDPDTTAPIYVWVTVDGVGRHLYANQDRPDVGAVYPAFGANHGFTGTVAAAPGSHRVCVTASNVGPGAHTPLGCRTVNVP